MDFNIVIIIVIYMQIPPVYSAPSIYKPKQQEIKRTLDDAEMMYLYWNDPATLEILNADVWDDRPVSNYETENLKRSKIERPVVVLPKLKRNIIQRNSVCEGNKLWLECEQHDLLDILGGTWAVQNRTSCKNDKLYDKGISDGDETELCKQDPRLTLNRVREQCQGEMRCQLMASENLLNQIDCKYDYPKSLTVDYMCRKAESRIKELKYDYTN